MYTNRTGDQFCNYSTHFRYGTGTKNTSYGNGTNSVPNMVQHCRQYQQYRYTVRHLLMITVLFWSLLLACVKQRINRERVGVLKLPNGAPHPLSSTSRWYRRIGEIHRRGANLHAAHGAEKVCDGHAVGVALKEIRAPADGGDAHALGADLQELAHRALGVRLHAFEELKRVVGVPVNDVHACQKKDMRTNRIFE